MRTQPLWCRPQLGVTAVCLLLLAGCFSDPDIAKMTCRPPTGCPSGYVCENPGPSSRCCKSSDGKTCDVGDAAYASSVDDSGSSDLPATLVDVGRDSMLGSGGVGGVDGVGGASGPRDVADPDTPIATGGTGGMPGSGGTADSDAPRAAGGSGAMAVTGGVVGSGGIDNTGGAGGKASVSGGAPGSGGRASGGAFGTGGVVASGGSGGSDAAGSGGVPSTGGAATGGTSTGGASGSGGAGDTHVNQPTLSPAAGSTITSSAALVVSFDETMKTDALVLSGTLGSAAQAAWNGTSRTLTLTPAAKWPEGATQHLGLSVSDLAGNPIVPIDVVYSVLNGVVYVKTTGSDSNPGTSDSPKATIPAAITQAAAYLATEVHIAQGTYNVSFDAGTHIVMKPGIAIMGGYASSSWATRDWNANTTTIQDIASTGGGGFDYKEAVYCDSTTNAQSIVDGFTIIGPSGVGRSDGIFVSGGSPTIRNNKIYAGSTVLNYAFGIEVRGSTGTLISHNSIYARGTGGADSFGVSDYQSASRIEYNYIDGGAGAICAGIDINSTSSTVAFANTVYGGTGSQSRAVGGTYDTTTMTVENNVLHGGAGTNVYGVYIASPGTIRNNTICGGVNGLPHGISIGYTSAAATIDNNIIFSGSSTSGYGIHEGIPAPHASVKIRNNDIWSCPSGLYYNGSTSVTTIAAMETYLISNGTTASGNSTVDPNFVSLKGADSDLSTMNDNNWSLSTTSTVKASGLNGAKETWDFTTDVTGAGRTPLDSSVTGWSMGAYEVN